MSDLHARLLAELDERDRTGQHGPLVPALRAVVELHAPQPRFEGSPHRGLECQGCDVENWDADNPTWPCRTIQAIARELGVDHG